VTRYHRIRKPRGTGWTSESSARANKARWDRDRAERDAQEPERLLELAAFPPLTQGDAIGCLEYRDFLTGRIRRWTILRGDRSNRIIVRTPDGRRSNPHGWTAILCSLRGVFAGMKS